MPISVACPTCGTKLKAPDDAAGKKVKCPKCATLIAVAAPEEEAEAGVSTAPSTPPEDQLDEMEEAPEGGDDEMEEAGGADDEGRPRKKKKKGRGPLREDDKTWGMFAHLAGTFFGWLGALIVFMMKKDESAFLGHHAKESLNFQITMIIGWLVVFLMSCCLQCGASMASVGSDLLGYLVYALSGLPYMVVIVANLILTIMQALKAKNGEWSKYPFAIRLIK